MISGQAQIQFPTYPPVPFDGGDASRNRPVPEHNRRGGGPMPAPGAAAEGRAYELKVRREPTQVVFGLRLLTTLTPGLQLRCQESRKCRPPGLGHVLHVVFDLRSSAGARGLSNSS